MRSALFATGLLAVLLLASCKKDDDEPTPVDPGGGSTGPRLILKFKFDSTQVRLNNIGQPSMVPAGHGAQSPRFNTMSAHYVEFAPTAVTGLGAGEVLYHAPETNAGGAQAIDHAQGGNTADGGVFLDVPLSNLEPGTYEWLRISLAYQNYAISFRHTDDVFGTFDLTGTLASFIGYNTYITSFQVNEQTVTVNDDKLQGFWAFEVNDPPFPLAPIVGEVPPGGITVPNPIFATSPIPQGSCVVTGAFAEPLVITGAETENVTIVVSLSTNKSFEWSDEAGDGLFEPLAGDTVVDMGIRGMIPLVQ